MEIEFDPAKDAANLAKHGLSLADAAEFDLASAKVVVDDRQDYGETRYRAFGRVSGLGYCLVFTISGAAVRVISLRGAHERKCAVMGRNTPPVVFDDDNPEWTGKDFARARPASEVLPPDVIAAFGKGKRGRPIGYAKPNAKKSITLRLDPDVIERWRDSGPGWQTRINAALRKALPDTKRG